MNVMHRSDQIFHVRGLLFRKKVFFLVAVSLCPCFSGVKAGEDESVNVRIIEQGIEHQRDGDGHAYAIASLHRYKALKGENDLYEPIFAGKDFKEFHDFDVDGDGNPANDTVGCMPFSLDKKNPMSPDAPFYDISFGQRWFGGATIYHANTNDTTFTENGMNDFEEGMGFQPRRNWTLFHEIYEPFRPWRMYQLAIWQKFDFMNGGDKYKVSFDENSRLAYLVMRYYMGIEGFRFVVRNGDKFYISEKVFKGAGPELGDKGGVAHTIYPAKEKWAEYNPSAPYRIDFDSKNAKFADLKFDDVSAVGWYMFKDSLICGYLGHKWYAFEADAVVTRPKKPSWHLDMAKIGDAYISKTEVPYETWRKIHRLKRSNTFVLQKNYTFDEYGDLGSMDYSASLGRDDKFSQDEPVTGITLHDMLAWCNALSEAESKEPCYYIDPEFKEKFREVRRSMLFIEPFKMPEVFVKWSADGYRIPTASELIGVSDVSDRSDMSDKTIPAAKATPNSKGICGLPGNVWEPVWDCGDSFKPGSDILLFGGDFTGKSGGSLSASPWGDRPYGGNWNIGLRVLRREKGGGKPADTKADSSIPNWKISAATLTTADPSRQWQAPSLEPESLVLAQIPGEDFSLGKTEVSFIQWKQVFNWAVAHGYEFDHGGEMGSMSYWGWGEDWKAGEHSTTEPVTGISHFDAMVWLNALSELRGKTPVYYHDKACKNIYKKSYAFRPLMMWLGEHSQLSEEKKLRYWYKETDDSFVKQGADGYRLPSRSEFEECLKKLKWKNLAELARFARTLDTSNLRTSPCGSLDADPNGLFDMLGNVSEMSHDTDLGKNKGCVYERLGGGFFDMAGQIGKPATKSRESSRGLIYPDTGIRVAQGKDNAPKIHEKTGGNEK